VKKETRLEKRDIPRQTLFKNNINKKALTIKK
jgi:hypothetical protein